ncbi:EscS/YscS/HrcS family type III secretion system export apparatus protein [Desulfuribacillus stibiiarsenatis]|uniref:Flagellar biosynthetic protein FliQ n=1 Tax=Desulfuribacillus stibiiarsenatis TaxID=1390249 RepID=A0A1E5L741_9FIRM|nr:flagellar biosynthesis protein FliQ [Desulfuribacillus stibiiarsenatis]OEH85834.1 EscS/YscS/HrcS family type III secretion system export apparatus protein [Desulfuribacillus stibiiarsenatis]
MSPDFVIKLGQDAVVVVLKVAGPMLAVGLGIGLIISIFQATTQIQEQTLTFVPKIAGILISLIVFAPWMINVLLDFALEIFENLHLFIG